MSNYDPKMPWGIGNQQIQTSSLNTITESKLVAFAVGQQKKTRFQKEREEKEQKKKDEDKAAAAVYDQFVASFAVDDDEEKGIQRFVRSTVDSDKTLQKHDGKKEMDKMVEEMQNRSSSSHQRGTSTQAPSSSSGSSSRQSSGTRGARQIDDFLGEIKQKQERKMNPNSRDEKGLSDVFEPEIEQKGSFDDGNPSTTNIYVGNLAPSVTEETLCEVFGRYGDINSAKVMWPRTEEERAKKRNCGFVSFMRRRDAEDAKSELHEYELEGSAMVLNWGKAVKINSTPVSVPVRNPPLPPIPPPAIDPLISTPVIQTTPELVITTKIEGTASSSASKWDALPATPATMTVSDPRIVVTVPQDPRTRQIIDLMAKFVAADGDAFERTIRLKEEGNSDFKFLFDHLSPEGHYYRWKTYSHIMGDSAQRWSDKPVQMNVGGVWMIPPESPKLSDTNDVDTCKRRRSRDRTEFHRRYNSRSPSPSRDRENSRRDRQESDRIKYAGMTGAQIERARAQERSLSSNKSSLTDEEYEEFRDMLLRLSLSRYDVKNAMAFMYDKVESAKELASLLKLSLLAKKAPLPIKIARLFLVSDILFNSGAPIKYASNFRVEIQNFLPEVFEDLGRARRDIVGRMTAHQVDERVKRLLEAWTEWSILSPNFLLGLEFAFVESDADMKAYLSELESINRLTKRDPTDDVAEFESLQRQAKLNGVFVAPSSTVRSLRVRLEYCRRYQLTKSGGKWQAEATYLPATQTLKPTGDTTNDKEYSIDDDLDGIHVDIDTTDAANMYSGDDEDIDGVPMDVPRSRDVDHVDTNVEDIDGLPLDDYDDVDGIAMDN